MFSHSPTSGMNNDTVYVLMPQSGVWLLAELYKKLMEYFRSNLVSVCLYHGILFGERFQKLHNVNEISSLKARKLKFTSHLIQLKFPKLKTELLNVHLT